MDSGLKQRLIGAAVLIALAVIFLPMLVKGPAPESGIADVPLVMPDAPQGEFVTRELPLVTPGQAGAGGALGMPQPMAPSDDAARPATSAPSADALPAATAGGDFAVHFGAYASRADADAVNAPLLAANLPGYVEQTRVGERQAWRVRIGPFATRAEAESVRLHAARVRDDVGARVVALNADAPVSASTPASAQATAPAATSAPTQASPQRQASAPTQTPPAPPRTEAPPAQTRPAESAPAPRPAAEAPRPTPPPATAPTPAPASTPAAADVGFAVQLGAFGNAEEATRLRDRARAAGFSAFTEQVRGEAGPLTRVRIGPVATRAEAERLKSQVDGRLGTAGMVRPHP